VVWANPKGDFIRTFDAIAIQNAEAADTSQVWNPLRTAATFIAPVQSPRTQSELVLICPNQALITTAFPVSRFPALLPPPVASGSTPVRIRVYDALSATFLTEIATTCNGLSRIALTSLDPVYNDAVKAPTGTYNEILGSSDTSGPFPFTGYLATSLSKFDSFGRLHGASVSSLQGTPTPGAR
jgi:hypothetical protein